MHLCSCPRSICMNNVITSLGIQKLHVVPAKARRERRTNKRTDRQTKWFLSGHLPLWHHKNMIYFTYDCPELIYTYVMKFKISDETGSIIAYFYRWLSGVDIHLCHEIQNQRWNRLHYCFFLQMTVQSWYTPMSWNSKSAMKPAPLLLFFTDDCPELIYTYVMKFKISDETCSIIAYFYRWLSRVDIHLCHEIQNQRWNRLHYCFFLQMTVQSWYTPMSWNSKSVMKPAPLLLIFTDDCPELIYTYVMKFKISDETCSIIAYFYRWLSRVDIHLCHEIQNQWWNRLHYCLPLERRCSKLSVIRHIAIKNCPLRFAFSHLPRCGQLMRQKHRNNFTWNLCASFS